MFLKEVAWDRKLLCLLLSISLPPCFRLLYLCISASTPLYPYLYSKYMILVVSCFSGIHVSQGSLSNVRSIENCCLWLPLTACCLSISQSPLQHSFSTNETASRRLPLAMGLYFFIFIVGSKSNQTKPNQNKTKPKQNKNSILGSIGEGASLFPCAVEGPLGPLVQHRRAGIVRDAAETC